MLSNFNLDLNPPIKQFKFYMIQIFKRVKANQNNPMKQLLWIGKTL